MSKRTEAIVEGLKAHREFLDAARTRNVLWVHDATDQEIIRKHLEIVNYLQQAWKCYNQLLERYGDLTE